MTFLLGWLWCGTAAATTYYVSSSAGNDANNGTSSSTPWQTVAQVNGQTFLPGDSVLFKRGDVWNESLAPPSSGSSGSPIKFDAYGAGPAPNLTGYYAVPASAWTVVSGNVWKATLPAGYTTISFCLFGSIWGQKQPSLTVTGPWDFYLAGGALHVYSVGNPASYYSGAIVPMAVSNTPLINVNGKSWLTFQHLLLNWFDEYGVYVQGASDHLVFANMEADSMIPQGTQPLGFYVNESTPGPGDIKIYNSEAHLNYDGFRFDGAASAISMVNDKAYANRDGALVDNTAAVTYSYCHFYASSLAIAGSTDVEFTSGTGPTPGLGNIAADTAPAVQAWQRYPARVTLTVDDAGMTPGADTYYASTVLPIADAAGVPVGVAITVGYGGTITPIISEIQGWINTGRDVTSHSISHTYYTNTDALDIQYTGSGTAATLGISGNVLTITVTGAADSVSYNIARGQPQGTILGLEEALTATGNFTATENPTCQGPYGTGCSAYTKVALLAQDLADVGSQDVKSSVYAMQLDVTRLTTDEITLSRGWMTEHLTGLPATPVYVYPGGYETTTMQGIAVGVPYGGARGALKEDLGTKDTYASGFDVQNLTSFGVNPTWQGLTPTALQQKVQALLWKEMVWGVPWGIFWHWNASTEAGELSATEITNLIADLQASGATIQTNTALVNWLLTGTQETGSDGSYYYKSAATSMALDFRPTASSPVVDAGQNLGTAYAIDINGINQNSYGTRWEIGAHAYIPGTVYGQGGSGQFVIGDGDLSDDYCANGGSSCYGTDGPANLPTTYYATSSAVTPVNPGGTTHAVHSATDLSNCLAGSCPAPSATLSCGDVIQLDAGVSYSGNFTLPALSCDGTHYTWIETSAMSSLPPEGTTINPGYAGIGSIYNGTLGFSPVSNTTAQVTSPGSGSTFTCATGAQYFRLVGLEITTNVATPSPLVVDCGNKGTPAVNHIIFDRIVGHGTPTGSVPHFFLFNQMNHIAFVDGYYYDIHGIGADNSVVSGGTSTTNDSVLKMVHNFLSASMAALFLGGGAATTTPSDVEFRLNHQYKPSIWDPNSGNYFGTAFVIKDNFEMKNVLRLLVEGNLFENTFQSGDTTIVLTPKNQAGNCATCNDTDMTFRYNYLKNAGTAVSAVATVSDVGAFPGPIQRVSVHDNVADAIVNYQGSGPYGDAVFITTCGGSSCGAPPSQNVSFNHNTFVCNTNTGVVCGRSVMQTYDTNFASQISFTPTAASAVSHVETLTGSGFTFGAGNYLSVEGMAPGTLNIDAQAGSPTNSSTITLPTTITTSTTGTTMGQVGLTEQMPGLAYTNNIVFNGSGGTPVIGTGGASNTAALNQFWATPFTFSGNVIVGGTSGNFPSGQTDFPATFGAVGFANFNNGVGGSYQLLPTSAYHNGCDGGTKDCGANVATVNHFVAVVP
jgi:hypothetical protein